MFAGAPEVVAAAGEGVFGWLRWNGLVFGRCPLRLWLAILGGPLNAVYREEP